MIPRADNCCWSRNLVESHWVFHEHAAVGLRELERVPRRGGGLALGLVHGNQAHVFASRKAEVWI